MRAISQRSQDDSFHTWRMCKDVGKRCPAAGAKEGDAQRQSEPTPPARAFHTCAATEYSSTSGSLVRWICSGSSLLSETLRPRAKKTGNGFLW